MKDDETIERGANGADDGPPEHDDAFAGSGFDPSRWSDDAPSAWGDPGATGDDEGWDPQPASGDLEDSDAPEAEESIAIASAAADAPLSPAHTSAEDAPPPSPSSGPSSGPPLSDLPSGPPSGAPSPAAGSAVGEGSVPDDYPAFDLPRESPPRPARTGGLAGSGGRVVPHDVNAEKCVLGALLLTPDRLVEVSEVCKPADFYDKRNRTLYECMLTLDERGQVVDGVTLTSNLRATRQLGEIGGVSYLGEIASSVSTSAHLKHHAGLVAETSKLRGLIEAAGGIIERAMETPPDSDEVQSLVDESEAAIFGVAMRGESRGALGVNSILDEVFHGLEAQRDRGEFTGIPSGFYDLDEMLGGFNPGEMTVIAARPAMGKTAFVLNIMDHAATHQADCLGYAPSVLFFSLEMGRASIVQRMLVARARVEAHRLRSGRLHDREYADLVEAAGALKGARLFIDDTPGLSIMALRSRARRLKAEHGLDMIVIDYLQLLSAKAESRQQEISMISRSLKELSRELEVPLITLAQLSRSVESREEKRPQLSDLRESGSIEQDADVVAMLYRPEYYFPTEENKGKAEVLVVKHRNGATGPVELQFQGAMLRFSNQEPSMGEPITGL
ncbi:MAG: replicative DNA helicase [Planctomycetota bacterium]